MSRTIREIRIVGKKSEEVKEHILLWFTANNFNVKEWASKGKRLWVYTWYTIGGLISPRIGSIVAVRLDMSGCIVFEINLKEEGDNTTVHGEFYAAGFITDLDLRPKSPLLGKFPREEGYILMTKFIKSLESFSLESTRSSQ